MAWLGLTRMQIFQQNNIDKREKFCRVKYQVFESSIKHEYECIKGGTDCIDGGNDHYTREGKASIKKSRILLHKVGTYFEKKSLYHRQSHHHNFIVIIQKSSLTLLVVCLLVETC